MNMTATRTYFDTKTIPDATTAVLIVGKVNRVRRIKIDGAGAIIGDSSGHCVKPVNVLTGEDFELGPGQELYARSGLQYAVTVSLIIVDQTDEGIYTDDGTGNKEIPFVPGKHIVGDPRPGERRAK